MKVSIILFVLLLSGCSSIEKTVERKTASTSSKIRFFESVMDNDQTPTTLKCFEDKCRYIEIEVVANNLSIHACSISESKLFYKQEPEKAVTDPHINSDCKTYLDNYEITEKTEAVIREQLVSKNISSRDPLMLLKYGSVTTASAVGAIVAGVMTVASAVDPVIPLFVVTGPGTAYFTGVAGTNAQEFITEVKGRPKVIYKSGSAKQIFEAIEKGGISTFYIGSKKKGFLKKMFGRVDGFDGFDRNWKTFIHKLRIIQNEDSGATFSSPASDITSPFM